MSTIDELFEQLAASPGDDGVWAPIVDLIAEGDDEVLCSSVGDERASEPNDRAAARESDATS